MYFWQNLLLIYKKELGKEIDRKACPFVLTALAFSVALSAAFLVPATLVADTLMALHNDFDYLSWLSFRFVFGRLRSDDAKAK